MYLIPFLLIFLPCSLGFQPVDVPEYVIPPDDFNNLFKILPRDLSKTEYFGQDFWTPVERHNFSDQEFSTTCFHAYLEFKLSSIENGSLNWEHHDVPMARWVTLKSLRNFMKKNNITDRLPNEWANLAPHTHYMINKRREFVNKQTVNAKQETKLFIQQVDKILMDSYVSYLTRSLNVHPIIHETVVKLAHTYRNLSIETKVDLERSLCIGTVMRWLSFGWDHSYKHHLRTFTTNVGLNVDHLMEVNDYLSSLSIREVAAKLNNEAEELNMDAQEYADTCAKTSSFMRLNQEEQAALNGSTENFMGALWGKKLYRNSTTLYDDLIKESAPFVNIVTKRWKYITTRFLTAYHRFVSKIAKNDLLDALLRANNRAASNGKEKIKLLDKVIFQLRWPHPGRMLDQVFCFRLTLQGIMKRAINITQFDFALEF